MRVLLVTTSFPLDTTSTSGIFVQRLAHYLGLSARVTVNTPCGNTHPTSSPARFATPTFRLHCFRYAPRALQVVAHQPGGLPMLFHRQRWRLLLLPGFLVAMLASCVRLVRDADIVHANWSITGVVAGLAGRLAGRPVVTTLRGSDIERAHNSALDRGLLRACLRLSDRAITVSEAMRFELVTRFPDYRERVVNISNGVEEALLEISAHPGDAPGARETRFCCIGNLIPLKGVHLVLSALHRDAETHNGVLDVIGDGPERPRLEALAIRLGLSRRVRFLGSVPPTRIRHCLQACDALILASSSEGRPNVVLEAMAAALPVIASDIDGVRELIRDGENGLLFPRDDGTQLADHMATLCVDRPLRLRLGQAGRGAIKARGLTWPNTASRYLELYRDVLRRQVHRDEFPHKSS